MESQQATPTVPSQPMEPPHISRRLKFLFLIFFIMLLAAMFIFGYYYKQSEQELSNQPTIKPTIIPTPTLSIKNNFVLTLPDGLVFNNSLVEDEAGNKIGEALPGVFLLEQNQSCETRLTQGLSNPMNEIVSSKPFSTALYPEGYYILANVRLDQMGPPTHALIHTYCLQEMNKAFSIYFYDSEEFGKAAFDQILSSFRFLEDNIPDEYKELFEMVNTQGSIRVIVEVEDQKSGEALLAALEEYNVTKHSIDWAIPYVALSVDEDALRYLITSDLVKSIRKDNERSID